MRGAGGGVRFAGGGLRGEGGEVEDEGGWRRDEGERVRYGGRIADISVPEYPIDG